MSTAEGNVSSIGAYWALGKAQEPPKREKGSLKYDHVITSQNLQVEEATYCWDFLRHYREEQFAHEMKIKLNNIKKV